MLSKLSPVVRLSLCLLLSAGLHGGLWFYSGISVPAELRLMPAPVLVSLLPGGAVAPAVPKVMPPEVPAPVPALKPQRHASKPVAEVPPQTPVKKIPRKPLAEEHLDKRQEETPPSELVCMTPQDVASNTNPEDIGDDTGNPVDDEVSAANAAEENGELESEALAASSALVEAVPRYRTNPLPEYPHLARRKLWQGVVWLLVDVSADGLVDDLRVEQSCGHKVLDRAASRTVRRWQFSPATRAGLPVASQVRIPVRFRLEDG